MWYTPSLHVLRDSSDTHNPQQMNIQPANLHPRDLRSFIDSGSCFPAHRTYDSAQVWPKGSQSGIGWAVGGPRWCPHSPGTRSGPAVAWAMGNSMEQTKDLERRAGTSQRDQETTQEPGGTERAGRSTLPSSRLMCLLLSWVQPSAPGSSLMKGSLRAELVIGGLQHLHWTQALLSDRGCLSICISHLWASELQVIHSGKCLSPFSSTGEGSYKMLTIFVSWETGTKGRENALKDIRCV